MKIFRLGLVLTVIFEMTACSLSNERISLWSDGFPSFFKIHGQKEDYAYGEKLLTERKEHFLDIKEIKSQKGITAWYVQDTSVPVVDLQFSFKKGSIYDPLGKEGTANLIAAALNEGAGELTSQQFQKIMTDNAIELYFDASKDGFSGHLRTTRANLQTAIELLRLAILSPRFDDEAVMRMKNEMIMGLRYRQGKVGWHAWKTMREQIFVGHPYARPEEGTEESIASITRDDLKSLWATISSSGDGLHIGVTGSISEDEVGKILDTVFAKLPIQPNITNIIPANLQQKGKILNVPWEGQQTYLLAVQEGIHRENPDWFSGQIINYVLAGGGFNSRLMDEVRVKNSLTYGISSSIIDQDCAPLWIVQSDVDNNGVKQTMDIIRQEWQKIHDNGITESELASAKAFLVGSLPLSLDSTASISSLLLQMQNNNLPIGYLDKRTEMIESITLDDIKRLANTLLKPDELTFILAGNK